MALDPNWRKAPAIVKLGRALFDPKYQSSLEANPAQIVAILTAAGVKIPKELQITVAIAQVIISGGAFVSAAESSDDIDSMSTPLAAALKAVEQILILTGVLNANSPMVRDINTGLDFLMVAGSMGSNVFADISLVLDMKGYYNNWQQSIQAQSDTRLVQWRIIHFTIQKNNFEIIHKNYLSGKIGVFQFMGLVAEYAPDLFLTYFPQFKGFIPTFVYDHSEDASETTWYGKTESTHSSFTVKTIVNDHKTVSKALIDKYAGLPLQLFQSVDLNYDNVAEYGFKDPSDPANNFPLQRISILDMAALSLMPPNFQVCNADFHVGKYLESFNLVPSDFPSGQGLMDSVASNPHFFPSAIQVMESSPIQFYPSTGLPDTVLVPIKNTQTQINLVNWDKSHDIGSIMNDPIGNAALKQWGTIPRFNPASWMKSEVLNKTSYGRKYSVADFQNLNITQLWTALSYLKEMKSEPFFKDIDFSAYAHWEGAVEYIEKTHRSILFKAICRTLNLQALDQIAFFFGVTRDKLIQLPTEPGFPVQFDIKQ